MRHASSKPSSAPWRRLSSLILALVVGLGIQVATPTPRSAHAGDDVCPEPNDQFQQACYLGTSSDALGFLSAAADVDAYRVEVLDFDVVLRVALAEQPFPYRLHLADWRGVPIAESQDEGGAQVITKQLGPPGSYYVFVDSRFGQFSDSAPYRVEAKLTYAIGVPNVLYSTEFRHAGDAQEFSGENEWGTYYTKDGRYHIDMAQGGDGDAAAVAWSYWGGSGTFGDFTFAADARVTTTGEDAGYFVSWRRVDDLEAYVLLVNLARHEILVRQFEQTRQRTIVPQTTVTVLNPAPEVNRIVVRAVGDDHRINVNGVEVARFTDAALSEGRIGLGALSVSSPVNVVYDNIIVTTPLR